jgi:hypothetical protein
MKDKNKGGNFQLGRPTSENRQDRKILCLEKYSRNTLKRTGARIGENSGNINMICSLLYGRRQGN